jgi:galactose mutarotase-like enzyme
MRTAILENDRLRVVVALDRGAEIIEFRSKDADIDPLLRLPGGPVHPLESLASIAGSNGSFLDLYAGGWQEILPNGGPAATHRGAEYGQHGEISTVPWSVDLLEDTPERITVACRVRALRTPLHLERRMTMRADSTALFLDENLTNEAGEDLDVMWGHHVAFGRPFLDGGARIDTSASRVVVEDDLPAFRPRRAVPGQTGSWPQVRGSDGRDLDLGAVPDVDTATGREMCYLSGFQGAAWYAIASRNHGFAMRWDGDVFRYLWLWQEFRSGTGFPWWKRVHAVALEPWTSFPTQGLAEAVTRGTQLVVPAGGSVHARLVAAAFTPAGPVIGVDADGIPAFRRPVPMSGPESATRS